MGGTPQENAATTRAILAGELRGAKRDTVLLNAGAAIYLGGQAQNMEEGVKKAAELIESGAALAKLEQLAELSNCG